MVELNIHTEKIPYEDAHQIDYFELEDNEKKLTVDSIHKKKALVRPDGCRLDIEVNIFWTDINIDIQVTYDDVAEYEWEHWEFSSETEFEKWCETEGISLA